MLNKKYGEKRIKQLTTMLCSITGMEPVSAELLVRSTDVGKLIVDGNQTILYEQQTENLAEIASELAEKGIYQDIVAELTISNIVHAARELTVFEEEDRDTEKNIRYTVKSKDTTEQRICTEQLKQKGNYSLKIKRQNQLNARRINNANKFKKS